MLFLMNVFYYYYYSFYKNFLKDDEPHMLTTLALSASEGLMINGLIQISLARLFCIHTNSVIMIGIVLFLIIINYIYYHRSGRAIDIIKNKPMFFSNNVISALITILFFIITSSFMFWEPIYVKQLMDMHCR
jgi:hypothetical protein